MEKTEEQRSSMIRRARKCRAVLIVLIGFLIVPRCYSQTINYSIHANISYHFTKYINWPGSKRSGDLIIGIVGDTHLYDSLTNFVADKSAGDQKIVVKMYSHSEAAYNCQILFISEDESGYLKKILLRTTGAPLLIVTESQDGAIKGSCINFEIVFNRVKIEINKNNIEQRHLSIASELLQLGKLVK
jgi:hypothetical protein